jgi:hypothetical protein
MTETDGSGTVPFSPTSPWAVRELRLHLYSAGQWHQSRRRLSAGGLAGWTGCHAELD